MKGSTTGEIRRYLVEIVNAAYFSLYVDGAEVSSFFRSLFRFRLIWTFSMLLRMKSVLLLKSRLRLRIAGSVSSPPTVIGETPVRPLGLVVASSGFSCLPRGLVGAECVSMLWIVSSANLVALRTISDAAVPSVGARNRCIIVEIDGSWARTSEPYEYPASIKSKCSLCCDAGTVGVVCKSFSK